LGQHQGGAKQAEQRQFTRVGRHRKGAWLISASARTRKKRIGEAAAW
jgi:hypothetical protein